MPWLVLFFGNIISFLVTSFAKFVTKRVAVMLSYATVFTSVLLVFVVFLHGLVISIPHVLPSGISIAVGWVIPDNFEVCLAAIITARLARYVWDITMHKFDLLFLGGWGN